MKTASFIKVIWLLALVICDLQNLAAQTNSQFDVEVDAAIASADVRHKLIAEYETATNSFHDGHLLAVAVSYGTESKYLEAIPVYRQFLSIHPDHSRALRGLAICYLNIGEYDKAAKLFERAWSMGDIIALTPLSRIYLVTSNYDRMEPLLPSLLQHETNNLDIVYNLMCYANAKKPLDEPLFLKALNGLPNNNCLANDDIASEVDTALKQFVPGLEITAYPQPLPKVTNQLVNVIWDKMIRGYNADPNDWPTNHLRRVAGAYIGLGEYAKAEGVLTKSMKCYPDDLVGLCTLGEIKLRLSKPAEANADWHKAWQMGRKDIKYPLFELCGKREDFDGMKELIPSLLAEKKDNPSYIRLLFNYSYYSEPRDPELFKQAIESLTDEELLSAYTDLNILTTELNAFGESERATRILKLKFDEAIKKTKNN